MVVDDNQRYSAGAGLPVPCLLPALPACLSICLPRYCLQVADSGSSVTELVMGGVSLLPTRPWGHNLTASVHSTQVGTLADDGRWWWLRGWIVW